MIPIPKDIYFEDYINNTETLEVYCEDCLNDPQSLKKIRRAFEKDIRSFLKEDYPDKIIEGTEIFDGELIQCWYEYQTIVDNNQMEFVN